MKKDFLFIAIFIFCLSAFAQAQTDASKSNGSFQFHLGLAFPQSDLVDDSYDDDALYKGSGNASMGLNLGIKYYSPLKPTGLSLVFSMDFLFNPLSKDFRDQYEKDSDGEDITFPKYINIPILGGLNYKIPVSEKLSLFGEGGIGLNILKITNFKSKSDSYELSEKYSPSSKLGYALCGGVLIQDKYSIALSYFGLGSHKSKYKWEQTGNGYTNKGDDKFERSLDIKELTLTFGIKI